MYDYHGSDLSLEELKEALTTEARNTRSTTLDRFQKNSPGVSRVYEENIEAARKYVAGNPSVMSNGMTPTAYLQGLGTPIGLHAAQFAEFIIYENETAGMQAYEVERRYLECRGILSVSVDGEALIQLVQSYVNFCSTVEG